MTESKLFWLYNFSRGVITVKRLILTFKSLFSPTTLSPKYCSLQQLVNSVPFRYRGGPSYKHTLKYIYNRYSLTIVFFRHEKKRKKCLCLSVVRIPPQFLAPELWFLTGFLKYSRTSAYWKHPEGLFVLRSIRRYGGWIWTHPSDGSLWNQSLFWHDTDHFSNLFSLFLKHTRRFIRSPWCLYVCLYPLLFFLLPVLFVEEESMRILLPRSSCFPSWDSYPHSMRQFHNHWPEYVVVFLSTTDFMLPSQFNIPWQSREPLESILVFRKYLLRQFWINSKQNFKQFLLKRCNYSNELRLSVGDMRETCRHTWKYSDENTKTYILLLLCMSISVRH
jgi:hypothetical protein